MLPLIISKEYSENLTGTGVHGALVVLEQNSFTSDRLAGILNIPTSVPLVCKHLATAEWKGRRIRNYACMCATYLHA